MHQEEKKTPDKEVALIVIHGMGNMDKKKFEKSCKTLEERLEKKIGKELWSKVFFDGIYYHDILQENQDMVFCRTKKHIHCSWIRKFLLSHFSDAAATEHKKVPDTSPYYCIQDRIREMMDKAFVAAGEKEIPVILLAQSLGAQIMSNYIWDASAPEKVCAGIWAPCVKKEDRSAEEDQNGKDRNGKVALCSCSSQNLFRRMFTLRRLYTTGCNIPIFVGGHSEIKAIEPPTSDFKWLNFYNRYDVLGWPLEPVSKSYKKLVKDVPLKDWSFIGEVLLPGILLLIGAFLWALKKVFGKLLPTDMMSESSIRISSLLERAYCHTRYWHESKVINELTEFVKDLDYQQRADPNCSAPPVPTNKSFR
uniref:Uncharacterized protein n=1 Tax=Candidatus Kentrum sp. LPFa TaxID=2126335 RepID=A0A450VYC2_9GAMM|nr:MAG: hypothetical protein BECKLPF1236A_GA0070988_100287 [Candidatus Kentron sp. LPFa]VFK25688.1 MAG: hypothetical protein BECKLPF1236C_GA0070990_100248 [Candidatus Kentron sp. LPFa]